MDKNREHEGILLWRLNRWINVHCLILSIDIRFRSRWDFIVVESDWPELLETAIEVYLTLENMSTAIIVISIYFVNLWEVKIKSSFHNGGFLKRSAIIHWKERRVLLILRFVSNLADLRISQSVLVIIGNSIRWNDHPRYQSCLTFRSLSGYRHPPRTTSNVNNGTIAWMLSSRLTWAAVSL